MGVLPEFRECGFGRKLIGQFEEKALRKKYTHVQVKSMKRFPAMLHLLETLKYKKCGCDEDGKIIFTKSILFFEIHSRSCLLCHSL